MSGGTFLDLAQDLMHDAGARAELDADPDAFLAARGFDGLSAADVSDAVGYVVDTLPADAASRLTDPGAATDGLARLAQLEPADARLGEGDAGTEPAFFEHDPSGEFDIVPDDEGDPMAADDEDPDVDPVGAHHAGEADDGVERLDEQEPDPGFGVGWEPGDADDVTAASPEFANVLDHPADLDLDVTHVPDLALEAADPISEAISWADHDEAGSDTAPLEHGHEAVQDGGEHHDDADHDVDLDL